MIIAFTGHRDKTAPQSELATIIARLSPDSCIHGAALGFDTQAGQYAESVGVPVKIYPPDYALGKGAPLIRNREMVDICDAVVACYDGRRTGGTFYTIEYAKKQGKPVHIIQPEISS